MGIMKLNLSNPEWMYVIIPIIGMVIYFLTNKKEQIKNALYRLSGGFTVIPIYMAVNITNVCGRSCNFCPYHSKYLKKNTDHYKWFRSQPNYLDYYEFSSFMVRNTCHWKKIKHIAITGKGEPLLHPHFVDFCVLINSIGIPFSITTNGDKLTMTLLEELMTLKYLTGIRVSIYEGSDLRYFKYIHVIYSKLTFFNQTKEDIPWAIKGYTVQNPGTEKFCSMTKDFNDAKTCKAPFSFLTVNTDGSIVPCYSYHETSHINDSFWKIWNGKEIRKYRRDALKMKTTMSDCKNCSINLNK